MAKERGWDDKKVNKMLTDREAFEKEHKLWAAHKRKMRGEKLLPSNPRI